MWRENQKRLACGRSETLACKQSANNQHHQEYDNESFQTIDSLPARIETLRDQPPVHNRRFVFGYRQCACSGTHRVKLYSTINSLKRGSANNNLEGPIEFSLVSGNSNLQSGERYPASVRFFARSRFDWIDAPGKLETTGLASGQDCIPRSASEGDRRHPHPKKNRDLTTPSCKVTLLRWCL